MALKSFRTNTLNTTSNINGLIHIERQTFTNVGAVNFNDCFSANFDTYKIVPNIINTTSNENTRLRLRASGSNNSTTNYQHQFLLATANSITGARSSSATFFRTGDMMFETAAVTFQNIELQNPFTNKFTTFFSTYSFAVQTGGGVTISNETGVLRLTTAFDGFSIFAAANNISGTIDVYGYSKG